MMIDEVEERIKQLERQQCDCVLSIRGATTCLRCLALQDLYQSQIEEKEQNDVEV